MARIYRKTPHPEWATKLRQPGTEIRLIRGYYYLYKITSKWDAEKKKSVKKTLGLLGRITEQHGLIEGEKYALKTKAAASPCVTSIREFGFVHFIQSYLGDTVKALEKHFPDCWQTILCMAYSRFLYQSPLKNMDFRFRHSYLSVIYPEVNLNNKHLSGFIFGLGEKREAILDYFNSFWTEKDKTVLFDVSCMPSLSERMQTLPRVGYNTKRDFDPQVNIMFIQSLTQRMPMYYRVLPGNIREVKAFALSLKECGHKEVIAITDKGFYSHKNLLEMQNEQIQYIMPLRRNCDLVDYARTSTDAHKGFDGYFLFEKRVIWYYTLTSDWGTVHMYLDEFLKTDEEKDYLQRTEKTPDRYTIEKYHEKYPKFGTIALLSNIQDAKPQEVFINYKCRNEIEVLFDAYKNMLHTDRTYMQNETSIEAWMFINFIALQWYYLILNLLKKHNLTKQYSPLDFGTFLTEIKKIKCQDSWLNAEYIDRTKNLLIQLGIPIV